VEGVVDGVMEAVGEAETEVLAVGVTEDVGVAVEEGV